MSIKKICRNACDSLRVNGLVLLLLEVITLIFAEGIFFPLIKKIFQCSVYFSRVRVVTNDTLIRYLRFPATWFFGLLILLLWFMAAFLEIGCLILVLEAGASGSKIHISSLGRMFVQKVRPLFHIRNILLIPYFLLILGVGMDIMNTQIISLVVVPAPIEFFCEKHDLFFWLFTAAKALFILIGSFGILVNHYMILDQKNFREAFLRSAATIRIHFVNYVIFGLLWILVTLVVEQAIPFISTVVIRLLSRWIPVQKPTGFFVLFLFEACMMVIDLLIHLILILFLFALLGTIYHAESTEEERGHKRIEYENEIRKYNIHRKLRQMKGKHRIVIFLLNLLMVFALVFWLWQMDFVTRISYMLLGSANAQVEVTAHRGSDLAAPENTIPAFLYACSNGADWLETDVHQLSDGTLVLFHDNNFKRISGLYQYIWESSWEDVRVLDVGSYLGEEWASTTICTLEDFLDFCEEWPDMKINLELKVDKVSGLDFINHVVDMVKEHQMESRVVFASSSIAAIRTVKLLDANLKTALVAKFVYGEVGSLSFVDYLSIDMDSIDWMLVKEMHEWKKGIWAWTLEDSDKVSSLVRLGVDNLITKDVVMTKEALAANRIPVGTEDSNLPVEFKAESRNRYFLTLGRKTVSLVKRIVSDIKMKGHKGAE